MKRWQMWGDEKGKIRGERRENWGKKSKGASKKCHRQGGSLISEPNGKKKKEWRPGGEEKIQFASAWNRDDQ